MDNFNSDCFQREIYKQHFISEFISKNFTNEDYFCIGVNGIDFS